MKETRIETSRRTICCDAFTLKPWVKIRALGLSPSSGSLPRSRSIRKLASSTTTPLSRRFEKFANWHRSAAIFHGNDHSINARLRFAEGAKIRLKSLKVAAERRLAPRRSRLPCRHRAWCAAVSITVRARSPLPSTYTRSRNTGRPMIHS